MRVKIAEWIAQYLVDRGIKYNFTVPGGGAMHLNVAFGHQEGLNNIFVQHEQAAAIAAEGYYRINNELPLVCCTTGPGGTNTLTGVLGAWLDSIPMFIISGQVRYGTTARYNKVGVRAMGDQEYDITPAVSHMSKYAVMITNPKMVKYHIDKALYLATTGRPGPVWLDIPLDIQGGYIDTDDFVEFNKAEVEELLPHETDEETIAAVIEKLKSAKRPVINAGSAIRTADAFDEFNKVVEQLNIPVVTGWNSIDLIPDEHKNYVGRAGLMGDRPGNWAIQNSDLILSVGSRLGVRQVGYNVDNWAREAFVIMVDIDKEELRKPSIHVEMPINADVKEFLEKLSKGLENADFKANEEWNTICRNWKKDYPVVQKKHYEQKGIANVYCFIKELSRRLDEGQTTVVGNGSACVVGSHGYEIKKGQRFIINSGAASMGYDLPASIGACLAEGKKEIICLSGDGSIQMNLQELQTIVFHKLPIKIFVINNQGYHSMRQTQGNLFPEFTTVGVGPESHDLSFPLIEKLAEAYSMPYYKIETNDDMDKLDDILAADGYCICEIFVDTEQKFEPKSATKRLPNGKLVSPPLEDLAPFIPRDELEKIMMIPLWPEV
ncbi:MAG: thiamine pyrophosphate-binding protein [Eubacteriales bacterium]|nr:thiamine pyrophosphate-binding protein [Eubacteriales bacterium]